MAIISKETIISAFDDKMTLLQWLKKLEKVLDTSTLASIKTIKVANTQYKIVLEFEDGTKFESEIIQLQSEIAGIQLNNGHLIFTLMNGNTIDAGLIDVSNLGNTTIHGTFEVTDGNATFGANVEVDGALKVNSTLQVGDTTTNDDELAKLPRTLLTPLDTPTEQELVGIDTANGQNRITIGDNLEVVNDKIKVINKFEQKEVNYKVEGLEYHLSPLTTQDIYTRVEIINNVLYLVCNFKVINNTGSAQDIYAISSDRFTIETPYSENIVDFLGQKVSEEITGGTTIAMSHAIATKDIDSLYDYIDLNMIFQNVQGANRAVLLFRVITGRPTITLQDGEELVVSGRMSLTLI